MATLLQHRLDPSCRLVRLMLSEYGMGFELEDVSPYKREPALTEINPVASLPVLLEDGLPPIIGLSAVIHYIEESGAAEHKGLMPTTVPERAEMWRLFDWVMSKFNDEVSRYVLEEKIGKRETKQGAPDPATLRAAKANLSEHMHYFAYLLATRKWLGGDVMTMADFALAAQLSSLDYLGDIAWDDYSDVKLWFARIKSRPAFRTLLADRVVGMPAASSYADLDF